MSATITRKLVPDPYVIMFEDGKRYETQRWITTVDDWRDVPGFGMVQFGNVHIGPSFPTADSVSPFYRPAPPPKLGLFARLARRFATA